MPQPPYVRTTLRVDGGPLQTGALTVSGNNAVTLRLENSTAIQNVRWEVYGYPEGYATPTGWTLDAASRKLLSTDLEPADLPIPDTATMWGKWLVDVFANSNQLSEQGVTGIQTSSPGASLSATAPGEGNQFGGYALAMEANWRQLDSSGGGGPSTLAGDVTGPGGANTVTKLRGKTLAASVSSPSVGQWLVYLTSNGGEYGLTAVPSSLGQVSYWLPGNASWALTGGPTSGQWLTFDGTNVVWGSLPAPTFAQVQTALAAATSSINVGGQKITGGAVGTNPTDFVVLSQLDAVVQGLDVKVSVRAATTANITLSGTQTIDGVSLGAGDRVLVKDQTTGSQNGLYVVAAGAWSRATDADTSAEVTSGLFTFVTEGTVNGDSGWVLTTNDPIVLGTTALVFAQFSGAGQITAGAGLTKSGNTLNIGANADGSIIVNADDIQLGALGEARVRTALAALTADPSFNSRKIVSLADGTDPTDAATYGQLSALTLGTKGLSLTGKSGTYTVLPAEYGGSVIRLTGAPSGDVRLDLPAQDGRAWTIIGTTSPHAYLVTLGMAGGALTIPILPGGIRRLVCMAGEAFCDDPHALVGEVTVSLIGATGADLDTILCKLPAGTLLRPALIKGLVSPAGSGTSSLSIGTAAGGVQVMQSRLAPSAGALSGDRALYTWGSDLTVYDQEGGAYYSAATLLYLRNAVRSGAVTAGSVRVLISAVYP